MSVDAALASPCFRCGSPTTASPTQVAGGKGEPHGLAARLCSPACVESARRFAARRAVQLKPSRAGLLVGGLGVVTAVFFQATGRDLGGALLVLALLGLGTTCLAYPDALPLAWPRRLGLERAATLQQALGVLLGLVAVALALIQVAFAVLL